MNKALTILLILTCMLSLKCTTDVAQVYEYEPTNDVVLRVKLRKLVAQPQHKSVFLYFDIEFENNASNPIYIHLGELRASLNNKVSTETYYDSLASVLPEKTVLERGRSSHRLYFVFPQEVGTAEVRNFKLVNYGVSTK